MSARSIEAAFSLRDFAEVDFDRLCEIDRQCFGSKIAFPPQTMREFLDARRAFALVAEDAEGGIAAFVIAGFSTRTRGHIATIDVAPPFRRRGLGERLLRAAEARLAAAGAREIRLESADGNQPAHRLFEKLGYRRTARIARYYPGHSDAVVLTKTVFERA
jgi:ribosomal-protein-alanine N-acetyltransferase